MIRAGQALVAVSLAAAVAGSAAAADVERGARLFARSCAACHGTSGKGDGPGARQLDPRPRDLTTRQYRYRSTPTGSLPLPADLERTIRDGLPGTSMPGYGELFSSDQLDDLIAFVYSLQPAAVLEDPLPAPLAIGPLPEATPERIRDGHALYLLSGCATCHDVRGRGKGPSARTLVDESERPIRPPDLRHDPLERGRDPEDVVRILRTGLNGAPMPSYDDAMLIARGDVSDVAGFTDDPDVRTMLEDFLRSSPTREEIDAMSESDRAALRDGRLAALAYYVLSLGRRQGACYWLFVERPEREPRSR
ncbi:MAG TPA: c-type cytochrome [Candidatus Polarisedimenticolaceae bacterium]|nr:c-type cytochrome [Candidatus Polarisedimenticolaceae bacterium]